MTHLQCEMEMPDLMERAYRLFKQLNPTGNHLSMFATDDGCCVMGFRTSTGGEIRDTIVDCYKSPRGTYRRTK